MNTRTPRCWAVFLIVALPISACLPAALAADTTNEDKAVHDLASSTKPNDQVQFDFETGDLQGWKVVEGGFENPVSDRAVFHNVYPEIPQNRYNKQGRFYLSTVERKTGPVQ